MSDEPTDIPGELPPLDPELAAWLAADPAPTMPEDVWSRLESALAAEPPLNRDATVVDLSAARERRRGRLWPVLAGAAGVALVGLVVLPAVRGGGGTPVADAPVTAEAAVELPAVPAPDAAVPSGDNEGASAAEPSLSAVPEPTPSDSASAPEARAATPRAMLDTGTAYSSDALPGQVGAILTQVGLADPQAMASAVEATPSPSPMTGAGMLSSAEALRDCLLRLGLPATAEPLVVDHGEFEGRDAGLVVTVGAMNSAGTPRDLHVVIVGTECTSADVSAARHFDLPVAAAS